MDAAALYQKQILALAREARASKRLDEPMHTASARNPTCGDRVTVDLNTDDDGRINAMGAKVEGCALCEAATGLMLTTMAGQRLSDTARFQDEITDWLEGKSDDTAIDGQDSFIPVKSFSARHGCVTLPFRALGKAAPKE
ncbi:MAG: hypothetical protein CNE91_04165 [SAR116 cluster bacterium MED-G04]|jgi:nitrogen fixation NifU-like protein|nr:MAG: hypothetical protein CNE91_04165 [SAR116 cluster bacterium MED-G04]HCD49069.1 hypothetical protein [Alphaproteobacteria bacterium]|tara:strand:- start:1703 stop:2122 length:420 start_codon:yes stop_codon:yes gene_type:complete